MAQTKLEAALAQEIMFVRTQFDELGEPQVEHKFHPIRKWRFDFAWPEHMVAAEAEGGTWTGGRHTRGKGFENDAEKYNTATTIGWHILRFTRNHIEDGSAFVVMYDMFKFLGLEANE